MRHLRILFVVLIIGYIVYDITNNADRDDSGNIISEGHCFNDTQDIFDAGSAGAEVQELPGLL